MLCLSFDSIVLEHLFGDDRHIVVMDKAYELQLCHYCFDRTGWGLFVCNNNVCTIDRKSVV